MAMYNGLVNRQQKRKRVAGLRFDDSSAVRRGRYGLPEAQVSKREIPTKGHNQHVVPYKDGWAVRKEGSNRATLIFKQKSNAIDAARKIASEQGSDLIVHGLAGQIFQRAEAQSTINENKIRIVIRKSATKTPQSSTSTKSPVVNSDKPKRNKK